MTARTRRPARRQSVPGLPEVRCACLAAMISHVIVHPLFHWSPTERRPSIQRRGLVLHSKPVTSTFRCGYICLSQSPSLAWSLSAGAFGERGQEWDCWQVSLAPDDEVEVRPFFGNRIQEFRVRNPIPKSRVWFIGHRQVPLRGRRY
jgi:hypothetical protein